MTYKAEEALLTFRPWAKFYKADRDSWLIWKHAKCIWCGNCWDTRNSELCNAADVFQTALCQVMKKTHKIQNFILPLPGWGAHLGGSPLKVPLLTQGSLHTKYCFVSAVPRSQSVWFPHLSAKANLKKISYSCHWFGVLCTQRMCQQRWILHSGYRTGETNSKFSHQYLDSTGMKFWFWWVILPWETGTLSLVCSVHITYHWRESRFFSSRSNFEFFFSRWKLFLKINRKGLKANATQWRHSISGSKQLRELTR